MKKTELDISNQLIESLDKYGAIKWHKNRDHSFYIKFRDTRLGSIRISNHKGREKYHYTYEVFRNDEDLDRKIHDIIMDIERKTKTIYNFDPSKYIVFNPETRGYVEVPSFREYKDHVLKRTK